VGVIPQLFITIGILVAQICGFKEFLARETTWHIHLAIPIIPSVIGTIMLMIIFPESPKALIIKNKDREAAENALKFLRNDDDVEQELAEIEDELNQNDSSQSQFGLLDLFSSKELRWPLITAVVLNIAQQLSGINAVNNFFFIPT
jgi:SP family facilitated glucose/fructose transporter-like MFS transporter 5